MTEQYTSRALQALREDQVRLTADHEVKKEELREVQKALNGVRKAIAALDPDRSSGGGVSSVDLVDEMKRYLGGNPDSDDNEVRQHMERYLRESGKSLRGIRTSFEKALRMVRTASEGEQGSV